MAKEFDTNLIIEDKIGDYYRGVIIKLGCTQLNKSLTISLLIC